MKKTPLLALIFTSLLCNQLLADELVSTKKLINPKSHFDIQENPKLVQVGFNATDFIRQFLVFNSNNLNLLASPYDINLKLFQDKWNLYPNTRLGARIGMGYSFTETSNTQNNSSSDFKTKAESFNYRLGIEFQHDLSKRFTVFYGLDFRHFKAKNFTENKFDNGIGGKETSTNEQNAKSRGAQLALGIQFKITNYLNLNTEALFGYLTGETSTKFTGTSLPNGRVDAGGSRAFFFAPPSFINLNFMF